MSSNILKNAVDTVYGKKCIEKAHSVTVDNNSFTHSQKFKLKILKC